MDINQSEREQAEQLLMEWYQWAKRWRPFLGMPRVSAYCRESRTSRQYEDEAGDDRVYANEMRAVQWCVNELPYSMQQAIGTEMRNREVGVRVWRNMAEASYEEALTVVMLKFRVRQLFVHIA